MPPRVIIVAYNTNLRKRMRELLGDGVRREETMRHSRNNDFGPALSPQEEGGRAVYNRLDVRSAMNMKLWFITGLVALVAFTPLAHGARKKTPKKPALNRKEKAQEAFKKLQDTGLGLALPANAKSLTDDMEALNQRVTLTDKQKTRILQMRAARDKALERWDKVNRPKFDAMQSKLGRLSAPKGLKLCKRIVDTMRAMRKARVGMVAGSERKFFGVLTPLQRGKWNAPILSKVILEAFSSVDLTEKQTAAVELATNAQAKRLTGPLDRGAPDQVTMPIKKYVYSRILTVKQRKAYAAANPPKKKKQK